MRALVIAHEPDCPAGQIESRLVERGWVVDTHVVACDRERPNEAAPWPSFIEYDLIVPMGSVRSLTSKDEIDSWIDTELDLLRAAHESGQPVLGICFGGQLLAEALGGSVEVAPVAEIGWFTIEAPTGAANPAGAGPWKQWHHDRFVPPLDAEVLAVNDNAVQLFRVGRTVGTQFHPEVDEPHVAKWVASCDDDYLSANGLTREKLLDDVRTHQQANVRQCHAFVDWFLDEVAFPRESS